MFSIYDQKQQFLLPPSLEELLEENHLARVVSEITESLDLSKVFAKYKDFGRPAYHPLMLTKILFYAYATGVRSSRKIAKALETDTAFMWLAAMNKPDFRTISDFRKNNLESLSELFSQIVKTCVNLNMATVGKIAIDGTKVKAAASKRKVYDEDGLNRYLSKIDKKIKEILDEAGKVDEEEDKLYGDKRGDELPPELKDAETRKKKIKEALDALRKNKKAKKRKKIVLTELDASLVKAGGRVHPGYNAQAVASSEGFLLASDVSSDECDNYQASPMIEKTKQNAETKPKQALVDNGYFSGETLMCFSEQGVDGFVPVNENNHKKTNEETMRSNYVKEDFVYEPESDCYVCPEGEKLLFEETVKGRGNQELKQYRCRKKDCASKNICTRAKKGRAIRRLPYEELFIEMREKMKTEEAKEIYKKRQVMIEPVFSVIKGPLNFDRFSLKGHQKVKGEWSLICSAFNIVKIWRMNQKKALKGAV